MNEGARPLSDGAPHFLVNDLTRLGKISSKRSARRRVTSVIFSVRSMNAAVRWVTSFSFRVAGSSNVYIEWTPDEMVRTKSKSALSALMSTSVVALTDALRRPPSC